MTVSITVMASQHLGRGGDVPTGDQLGLIRTNVTRRIGVIRYRSSILGPEPQFFTRHAEFPIPTLRRRTGCPDRPHRTPRGTPQNLAHEPVRLPGGELAVNPTDGLQSGVGQQVKLVR
jgi:hypothetical protein